MSVDDTSAIVLQDDYDVSNNSVYRLTFTKGSVVCTHNNYDNYYFVCVMSRVHNIFNYVLLVMCMGN